MRTLSRGVASGRTVDDVRHPRWWHWIACYALYAAVLYLCYQGFWLCRSSVQDVTDVLLSRDMSRPVVYMASTGVLGLVFFSIAMGAETYLRGSLTAPLRTGHFGTRLAGRFLRLVLIVAVPVALGAAAQEALFRAVG